MRGQIAKQEPLGRKHEAEALNLRMAGATYAQIGKQIGITESGARRAYKRALERLAPIADREEARALEATRYDTLQVAHWRAAVGGDEGHTSTVLSIMDRRAKLLGLNAPAPLEITGKDGGPFVMTWGESKQQDEDPAS